MKPFKPNLKPFDLKQALSWAPVATAQGHLVTELAYYPEEGDTYPIKGCVEGIYRGWTENGEWLCGQSDPLDLRIVDTGPMDATDTTHLLAKAPQVLQSLLDAHIEMRGNFPLPGCPDYEACVRAKELLDQLLKEETP